MDAAPLTAILWLAAFLLALPPPQSCISSLLLDPPVALHVLRAQRRPAADAGRASGVGDKRRRNPACPPRSAAHNPLRRPTGGPVRIFADASTMSSFSTVVSSISRCVTGRRLSQRPGTMWSEMVFSAASFSRRLSTVSARAEDHHRTIVHRRMEGRARQHQSVHQRHRHAHRNSLARLVQHAAGCGTVDVELVPFPSVACRNHVGLAVLHESRRGRKNLRRESRRWLRNRACRARDSGRVWCGRIGDPYRAVIGD